MALDLFGKKEKQAEVENEILQKFAHNSLLDTLISYLLGEDLEEWMIKGQSYYDTCTRTVSIGVDSFDIIWDHHENEKVQVGVYENGAPKYEERSVRVIDGHKGYSFTGNGYVPLHGYTSDKINIPADRVCYLMASILRERMKAKLPQCNFQDVRGSSVNTSASFIYEVPKLSFKDWF